MRGPITLVSLSLGSMIQAYSITTLEPHGSVEASDRILGMLAILELDEGESVATTHIRDGAEWSKEFPYLI